MRLYLLEQAQKIITAHLGCKSAKSIGWINEVCGRIVQYSRRSIIFFKKKKKNHNKYFVMSLD